MQEQELWEGGREGMGGDGERGRKRLSKDKKVNKESRRLVEFLDSRG